MTEEWRDIVWLEGSHQISSLGRVRSLDRFDARGWRIRGKIFCTRPRSDGHTKIGISKNAKRVSLYVHRSVAEAFIPNPDEMLEVGHLDGNRTNNSVDNLYWTDHGDTVEAAYACGSNFVSGPAGLKGAAHPCSKLNEKMVVAMREFSGTHLEAATTFGVSHSLASKVRRGELWGNVA